MMHCMQWAKHASLKETFFCLSGLELCRYVSEVMAIMADTNLHVTHFGPILVLNELPQMSSKRSH